MFFAINSQTNEKVNSLTVEQNPSYKLIHEDVWLADPDEIESCPNELDITKIRVSFREGKSDVVNYKGTKYDISPHFFIPNKSKLGINTIPESKEHKLAKNWIYNKLKSRQLTICYSEIHKPYKYQNKINLFDLPIDMDKIGIEVTASTLSGSRRADIICPFLTKHEILGLGIVIEIQFSKQRETTKFSRELDWSIRGYSLAWLHQEDFNHITELIIDTKKEEIDVDSYASLIKLNNKTFVRDLQYIVKESCREFDNKKNEIEAQLLSLLDKVKAEKVQVEIMKGMDFNHFELLIKRKIDEVKYVSQPNCPNCKIPMTTKKGVKGLFWGCANYPACRQTMQIY